MIFYVRDSDIRDWANCMLALAKSFLSQTIYRALTLDSNVSWQWYPWGDWYTLTARDAYENVYRVQIRGVTDTRQVHYALAPAPVIVTRCNPDWSSAVPVRLLTARGNLVAAVVVSDPPWGPVRVTDGN